MRAIYTAYALTHATTSEMISKKSLSFGASRLQRTSSCQNFGIFDSENT